MFRTSVIALAAASGALFSSAVYAEEIAQQPASPVLVEVFLSQSCSSCTQAAEMLPDLATRKDAVTLSWHVDYWNMANTRKGRWADPYSRPEFTTRQKKYNMRIRSRNSVYTPQVVVDGAWETIGSSQEKVVTLIEKATQEYNNKTWVTSAATGSDLTFEVGASATGGNAYLVTFKKSASTDIPAGENAGRVFKSVNIVTNIRPLGVILRRGAELRADRPAPDEGCALIVQEPNQARIIAATYCPA